MKLLRGLVVFMFRLRDMASRAYLPDESVNQLAPDQHFALSARSVILEGNTLQTLVPSSLTVSKVLAWIVL